MKSIFCCLALLFALSSCEQVIEPDLPEHTPRLVLHAFFTADGIWTAYVGRSSGILESRPLHERSVADASVELLAGDRVVEEMKFLEAARVYAFEDSTLEAGETYSLQVSAPGFATIRATDAIPKPVPTSILSYRTDTSVRSGSETQQTNSRSNWKFKTHPARPTTTRSACTRFPQGEGYGGTKESYRQRTLRS